MTKVTVEIEDVIGQFERYDDEIRRLRAALRMLADLENWNESGQWTQSWDLGSPWEFANAALGEKE